MYCIRNRAHDRAKGGGVSRSKGREESRKIREGIGEGRNGGIGEGRMKLGKNVV